MIQVDLLIHDAAQLITCAHARGPKRGSSLADVGLIENGAVAVSDGKIVAVGPSAELQSSYDANEAIDASGRVVCPGFVDCHTHIVYAGSRVQEFEMRLQGASYLEIMAAGGGILSTMHATRQASASELAALARPRLAEMLALGSTTVEIKTGYGLETSSELEMLRAIELLAQTEEADIVPTFLGAHAIPPAYSERPHAYVDLVVDEMLVAVANWYDKSWFAQQGQPLFNDVFCEQNALDYQQTRRVLEAGLERGMPAKLHADEFTALGGVELAVELGAVSVDHLDVTSRGAMNPLANAKTVAVLLPAVSFNLGSTHFADARALIDAGAAVALSTDYNPGSAPCPSLPLVMALATRYQRLLPAEALNAITINAAHAVGLGHLIGSLETGKQADLLVAGVSDHRHLAYEFGGNPIDAVFKKGRLVAGTA